MFDIEWDEIVSIEECGEEEVYDITLLEDDCYLDEPNFVVDDCVVHNCGMHTHYANRKKSTEAYELHPVMKPFLGNTYGVMIYQEQIMQVLNAVGGIPLKDCEIVRKAISKKKEKVFAKYKVMFLENGQKTLGWSLDAVQSLWDQIVAFAEYGFNKCVTGDSLVQDKKTGRFYRLDELAELFDCDGEIQKIMLDSVVEDRIIEDEVVDVFFVGEEEAFEVELENGLKIKATIEHQFLCDDNKKHTLGEIVENNLKILCV